MTENHETSGIRPMDVVLPDDPVGPPGNRTDVSEAEADLGAEFFRDQFARQA